jgi:hypothetical protein
MPIMGGICPIDQTIMAQMGAMVGAENRFFDIYLLIGGVYGVV